MVIKVICRFPSGDLKFATCNIQDGGGNWENRITGISSLSRNIGEDKAYEISGMSIDFNDSDRFFRKMMSGSNRFISGHQVELYSQDDLLIYTGSVEKWGFQEDAFVLHINDRLSGLEVMVPEVLSTEDYPNMAEKADGASVAIIFGTLEAGGGAVKCWRVNSDTFLIAGHHCRELLEAFEEDGTALTGAALDNNADGRAYITCSSASDFIFANVKGKENSQFDLIEDPIDALKDIIDGYTSMDFNTEAMDRAQTIAAKRNYKIAAVIDNQQTLQDILVTFCYSFDADFYLGKSNEIMISLLDWSELSPVRSFTDKRIVDFQIEEQPDQIRNKVKYKYHYNFASGEFQRMPIYAKESSIVNWGEFFNKNEALNLNYVSDSDSAFDVVQRFVIQHKNPRREANISLPLSEFIGIDISDIIEIQHPNAIDDKKRKYQVRRVEIDFTGDLVHVEAVDVTTLTGGMFVFGSREDPLLSSTWDENDDYSRQYGYLADRTDNYFSNNTDYGKVLY